MIPICRAKRKDHDEWIIGYLTDDTHIKGEYFISEEKSTNYSRIDTKTLAIHFPNMIDKNGKKIFASLSEDGVGGDILKVSNGYKSCESERVAKFPKVEYNSFSQNDATTYSYKVIGIHKG